MPDYYSVGKITNLESHTSTLKYSYEMDLTILSYKIEWSLFKKMPNDKVFKITEINEYGEQLKVYTAPLSHVIQVFTRRGAIGEKTIIEVVEAVNVKL